MSHNLISVEVAYATFKTQRIISIEIEQNSTILEVILKSEILKYFPEIDLSIQAVGVFGEMKPLMYKVEVYDRVEIYRPLLIDPKVARRNRSKK